MFGEEREKLGKIRRELNEVYQMRKEGQFKLKLF
jgi:hypothetical protein